MVRRNTQNQERMRRRIAASKPACHICGQPISYDLPYSDPKSFVIDHVIPLAKGGVDALHNVKAAHRRQATATARRGRASSHPSSSDPAR